MLTAIVLAVVLCLCLAAWAKLFKRLAYWLYTTDLNRLISPKWYEKNREKIEAMKARGSV